MKKEYISPITDISNVEILNMICQSPADDWDPSGGDGDDGDDGEVRCRNDYGRDSDFGSLW